MVLSLGVLQRCFRLAGFLFDEACGLLPAYSYRLSCALCLLIPSERHRCKQACWPQTELTDVLSNPVAYQDGLHLESSSAGSTMRFRRRMCIRSKKGLSADFNEEVCKNLIFEVSTPLVSMLSRRRRHRIIYMRCNTCC